LIRGVYISATGMVAETIRTDTIANNLANVNTTGYKKDVAVNNTFDEMLIYRINDGEKTPAIGNLGLGTIVDEIESFMIREYSIKQITRSMRQLKEKDSFPSKLKTASATPETAHFP